MENIEKPIEKIFEKSSKNSDDKELLDFLDSIDKKGKLDLLFKVLDVLADENINDEEELNLNMDEIIDLIKPPQIEELESKQN
jgi:hypothetical protein